MNVNVRRLLALFPFLAFCVGCGGSPISPSSSVQTFTLSGRVTDSATGLGLVGAIVSVGDGVNTGRSSTTDGAGSYAIAGLQQSGFTLTASVANYRSASKAVTLTTDQTLSFQLLRSVLTVQGTWAAPWTRQSCTDTGNLVGLCDLFNGGTIVLSLTQSGAIAQGTLVGLGSGQMNVAGSVGTTGILTLTGQGQGPASVGGTVTLGEWQSQVSENTTMAGSFTFVIVSPSNTAPGTVTVTATFEHVPRIG
jgi:hypothetical protein